ncbi:MAG TPA: TraR/DksA C4-type zinc finger protein [Chitinophagaceae bacterium]|nr:TraR/DksA C4-type zinc finger protein [Chitinophagaceae bacterium]
MASKKKKAPKKAGKPIKKTAAKKPAAKKSVKKSTPKPASRKAVKTTSKKVTKPVAKSAAKPAQKAAAKPTRPAGGNAVATAKPAVKAVVVPEPPKAVVKKPGTIDPKSLVSIKPKVKPVIKKEPPKPLKMVIPKTTTKTSVKYEPEFTKSVLDASMYQPSTGPTQRYSDNDLNEFREIIQKKLDAAKKELAYLQGLITRKDEGGDMDEARYMTMEDGSVSMEREQLSQMASRQITFIDHLEKAMMRIENKTYGICRVTGKLIDKARLRAVPHATLSIEAKQMMNK